MKTTTSYILRIHSTGKAIAESNLTQEQFSKYEAMAQQPEGIIRLGDLPHNFYNLAEEFKNISEDTTVFFE